MKASEIYRMAAESIANGSNWGACWAIALAHTNNRWNGNGLSRQPGRELCAKLKGMYAPDSKGAHWLDGLGDEGRILALCFMAAIAESEGD